MIKSTEKKWLQEIGIILLLAAISMLVLYPMLSAFSTRLPFATHGDVRLSLSILFSNLDKISRGQFSQIYHLPIVFPTSFTMTAGVNLFGQTLLLAPLYLLGNRNIYLWYNLLTLFAYVAAGYAAYLFIREFSGRRWIAVIAAALYMLLPSRVHNIPQFNLLFSFPTPLAFLCLHRYFGRERRRDLLFLSLAVLLQFLFDLSLGLFLVIALAVFFVVCLCLQPHHKFSFYLRLAAAGAVTFLVIVVVFSPYLDKDISFSDISDEVQTIGRNAFQSSLSFYSNWNYPLLFLKSILWNTNPYYPGFAAAALFLLAFWPALAGRGQKIVFALVSFFLLAPALVFILLSRSVASAALERLADAAFACFLAGFILLLVLLNPRLAAAHKTLAWTWLILLFSSSRISLAVGNLFSWLSHVLPVLVRSRGIRTQYIILLFFYAVAAVGFRQMWERKRPGHIMLALLALLLLAERVRWPIGMERVEDDRSGYSEFYERTDSLPPHLGLLELPFHKEIFNYYTYYTRYHRHHTYHGQILYLLDPLHLEKAPGWDKTSGFAALSDPTAVAVLRDNGIGAIMLFRDKISSELPGDRRIWRTALNNIDRGQALDLYTKVDQSGPGIVLFISGRQTGRRIDRFLPYFALAGSGLRFTLESTETAKVSVYFNDRQALVLTLPAGGKREIRLSSNDLALTKGRNMLRVGSDQDITFDDLSVEK